MCVYIVPAGTLVKVIYRKGKVDDDSVQNTMYLGQQSIQYMSGPCGRISSMSFNWMLGRSKIGLARGHLCFFANIQLRIVRQCGHTY